MKRATGIILALALAVLLAGCAGQQAQISYIGADAARALALEAAGAAASAAEFYGTDMGSRNGMDYYRVGFTAGGVEYEYCIDALSGMVIEGGPAQAAQPAQPIPTPASQPTPTPTSQPTPAPTAQPAPTPEHTQNGGIAPEEAKELALSLVPGAGMEDIREFETDYDDGRLEYEGKVIYREMEYEFEIDGYSGSIRSWEAESIHD